MPGQEALKHLFLNRSPVDITDENKTLRLCTLILNPRSPFRIDTKFGFNLRHSSGEFYVEEIDEGSPANISGLSNGDRVIQVDGIDTRGLKLEQVFDIIEKAEIKSKLKLLVAPHNVINYGNPAIANDDTMFQQKIFKNTYDNKKEAKISQKGF